MKARAAFPEQAGLSLPMVVFIIVVIGLLATAMAVLLSAGSRTAALDTLAARAYFAAQSGAQWGVYQLTPATGNAISACFSDTALNFSVAGLESCNAAVSCTQSPASGSTAGTFSFQVQSAGICTAGGYSAFRRIIVGTSLTAMGNGCQSCIDNCINQDCNYIWPFGLVCDRTLQTCTQSCLRGANKCIKSSCSQFADILFCGDGQELLQCLYGKCPGSTATTSTTSLRYWLEQNQ